MLSLKVTKQKFGTLICLKLQKIILFFAEIRKILLIPFNQVSYVPLLWGSPFVVVCSTKPWSLPWFHTHPGAFPKSLKLHTSPVFQDIKASSPALLHSGFQCPVPCTVQQRAPVKSSATVALLCNSPLLTGDSDSNSRFSWRIRRREGLEEGTGPGFFLFSNIWREGPNPSADVTGAEIETE